ncbi:MAG: hypothetical protein HC906_19650, partial [Bacteroidales bacterium]|nr:hypothetical protein [Bacteroidales bacterium]
MVCAYSYYPVNVRSNHSLSGFKKNTLKRLKEFMYFRFSNSDYLYLLTAIPVFIIIYIIAVQIRKKGLRKFGHPELVAQLMPDVSKSRNA